MCTFLFKTLYMQYIHATHFTVCGLNQEHWHLTFCAPTSQDAVALHAWLCPAVALPRGS